MADEILEKVQEITARVLGVDREMVRETSNFSLDLGADSLDTVELVMSLEDEFKIDISDVEAGMIYTVAEAVTFIKLILEKQNG
jgi:acyl carrier protein